MIWRQHEFLRNTLLNYNPQKWKDPIYLFERFIIQHKLTINTFSDKCLSWFFCPYGIVNYSPFHLWSQRKFMTSYISNHRWFIINISGYKTRINTLCEGCIVNISYFLEQLSLKYHHAKLVSALLYLEHVRIEGCSWVIILFFFEILN